MKKNTTFNGAWIVFLAAVCWSLNAPIVKFLTLSPLLISGLRSLIAGIVLLPFFRPKKLVWNGWMIVYLLSYIGLCIGIILALDATAAPIAIGMQYTSIIWLFFINCIRTKSFSTRSAFPVGLIMIGVIFFMTSATDSGSSAGNMIALTEGFCFMFMTISSPKISGDNPLGLTALANLCVGIFVFAFLSPKFSDLAAIQSGDWSIMLVLGIVQVALGYGFYNIGVRHVSAQKASILVLWELILGPIWVALFLKEYPSVHVLIGYIIILAGMVAYIMRSPNTSDESAVKHIQIVENV